MFSAISFYGKMSLKNWRLLWVLLQVNVYCFVRFKKVILPIPLLFNGKRKSGVSYFMSLGRQKQQLRLLPKNANSTP